MAVRANRFSDSPIGLCVSLGVYVVPGVRTVTVAHKGIELQVMYLIFVPLGVGDGPLPEG